MNFRSFWSLIADHLLSNSSVLDVATCDVLMAGIADGMNTENAFLSINGDKPINLAHSNYEDALKAIAFELKNVI